MTPLGCASSVPFAAEDSRPVSGEVVYVDRLDAADQSEVLAALAAVAGDHRPVSPPAPAPLGLRFSDLDVALATACSNLEMAVVGRSAIPADRPETYEFRLKTIDGRPGHLAVHRTDDARIYTADATIGRFGDDRDAATRLIAELDRVWRRFGAKRAVPRAGD